MTAKEFFEQYPDVDKWVRDGVEVEVSDKDNFDYSIQAVLVGYDYTSSHPFRTKKTLYQYARLPQKKYRYMTEREALIYISNMIRPEDDTHSKKLEYYDILRNAGEPYTGKYSGQWYIIEQV